MHLCDFQLRYSFDKVFLEIAKAQIRTKTMRFKAQGFYLR